MPKYASPLPHLYLQGRPPTKWAKTLHDLTVDNLSARSAAAPRDKLVPSPGGARNSRCEFQIQNVTNNNYLKKYNLSTSSPLITNESLLVNNFNFNKVFLIDRHHYREIA